MSRGILSKAEKEKLADSRKQVAKVLERDANLSDRDLYDRLLKQARMPEQDMYEEKLADNALIHQRPAFSEVPGGYTPMPAALQQAAQGEYYHSFQGLFPQIHRAWMTIDHVLYLWDYNDPRGSFYLYDGLDQTIIHASLVRPRQGVFEPTPDWLLLLSTPVEVILLGLYTTATHDINVFETGYSVATDGANLLQIVGTPSGRIFMAGADGFVYELTYGDSEGWFYTNKKCTKRTAHASETWRCNTSVQWCTTPRTPSSIWCTMLSARCCTRSRVRRRCSSSTLAGTARALCGSSRVSRPRSSLPTSDPRAKCATRPSTRRWIRTSRRASRTKKGRPPSWRSRRSRRRSPSNFSS